MATTDPTALTTAWTLLGADGFEYLLDIHDGGSVNFAFASSTPAATVLGHAARSGDVLVPPTGLSLYGRSTGGAATRVTVTQGNALA